jgi:hypothetical protein
MTKPFTAWTVLPHGPLTYVTDDILTVVGDIHMPIGEFPRRMTVVRLANGDLIIFSAIALGDAEMRQLEAFGRPAWLVVPSDRHRLDAHAWKARYPDIKVIAPAGARPKVSEVVAVDTSDPDFGDPSVRFIDVPGAQGKDAALEIHGPDGLTLVVNEIIGNIHGEHGLKGFLLKLLGFAGEDGPHVPEPVKLGLEDGKAALAAQLERWGRARDLKRIIVSHGDIIENDPAGVLRKLAADLT